MIKVKLSSAVFEYRQALAELVNEVRDENEIAEVDCETDPDLFIPRTEVTELGIPGLLRPPKIEEIELDLYLEDGHLDGIILIGTSEYFGVMNVYVTLQDDQGHQLESHFAVDNEDVENYWGYIPSAPASPGTTIIVRAIALDCLGGVAIKQESITV